MHAMVVVPDGDTGTLRWQELPDPEPSPGEVLIAVRAAAVNRADLQMRRGAYRQEATARRDDIVVAGLECAGEVVACGPGVEGRAVGDRVMTMCSGGYAELVTVDARLPMPAPAGLSWEQTATLPVALMTEFDALVNAAGLRAGESVLITAGGSGVGLIGVQLAKALGAGTVIASVLGSRQRDLLTVLGADTVVEGTDADLVETVRAATGGGVEIVIDHVGAAMLAANLDLLAVGGRLVSVGRLAGTTAELDMDLLARKRISLFGVTFRTRTLEQYGAIARQVEQHVLAAVAAGVVRPHLGAALPLAAAVDAQEQLRAGTHFGKIVLTVL